MRTTIHISQDLYARVRARAASTGRSVDEVVEDALRTTLADRGGSAPGVQPLPTFGGSGVLPGVDLASNPAMADRMDAGGGADALL